MCLDTVSGEFKGSRDLRTELGSRLGLLGEVKAFMNVSVSLGSKIFSIGRFGFLSCYFCAFGSSKRSSSSFKSLCLSKFAGSKLSGKFLRSHGVILTVFWKFVV